MLRPRLLDVMRCRVFRINAGLDTGLVDVGVHVVKLLIRNVDFRTAEHLYGIRYRLPVEGHIVLNIEIQV